MERQPIEGFRLSPQQRHIWLLHERNHASDESENGDANPYWSQCVVRIDGDLDKTLLCECMRELINRHEILRTSYQSLPGMTIPLQVISDHAPVIGEHDLAKLKEEKQPRRIEKLLAQARQEAMDYRQGPLTKMCLLRLSQRQHVLLISSPVLCADRKSLENLVRELSERYGASSEGTDYSIEAMQYADFAAWQNELLESKDTVEERGFWNKHTTPDAGKLSLQFEKRTVADAAFRPRQLTIRLDSEVTAALKRCLANCEASAPDFLQACWQILLWRHSGQTDVTVGKAFDGRPYDELETAMGLFERYLPIRYEFDRTVTFLQVLQELSRLTEEACEYQEYFREKETEDGLGTKVAPYCFDFIERPVHHDAGGVSFAVDQLNSCAGLFRIKLSGLQENEIISVALHYDANAVSDEGARCFANQFHMLLKSAVSNPQTQIHALEMLSDAERHRLLVDFNDTTAGYSEKACFHRLFEEQVVRTPDAIAVQCEEERMPYTALNARANQLAHFLQKKGVQPDEPVAIYLDRSPDMLVALLGILKSDAAYVPLDLTYPAERLAFMLADAGARLMLTNRSPKAILDYVGDDLELSTVDLRSDWDRIAEENAVDPAGRVRPGNLAYIIYTSGSTGRPKGTMISHRSMVNYLTWCVRDYAVATGQGSLVHSPIGFDLTVTTLFAPLLVGKRVILMPENRGLDALAKAVCHDEFSLIKITPAHLEVLGQLVPDEEAGRNARTFIIGGEALTAEALSFWLEHAPDSTFVNEYGPTEATVGCCHLEVPQDANRSGAVPIGGPIQNTQLYVLDCDLNPVGTGVPGELYIAGAGLARGYLNRPDLTAEMFVPNPFSKEPGVRMYRTGDLARHLVDGSIEFIGRSDRQIKVRGFRVELSEIENVLVQHPEVRDAIVLSTSTGASQVAGVSRLLAYIVTNEGGDETAAVKVDELRRFLEYKLPEYMLPAAFITLSSLPLTPNGKVDLQALPEPAARPDSYAFMAPTSREEEVLAGIMSKVLAARNVGIDDNYFALGGDSIRAIQVVAQAGARGIDFSVDQLFKYPTIRQLLRSLKTINVDEAPLLDEAPFSMISPEDRSRIPHDVEDAYPMIMLQGGMVFHREYSPGSAIYHDIFSLHLKAPFENELLQTVIKQLFERHPVLRAAFDLSNFSEPLQLVYETCDTPLQVDDLRDLRAEEQEAEIRTWIAAEKLRGFDISRSPLLRFQVHRRTEGSFQFTWSFHHAIIDGWSDATMITELFDHYFSLLNGEPVQITPPASSFREYVVLEREALASSACRDYWHRKLSDSNLIKLPRLLSADPGEKALPRTRKVAKLEVSISYEIAEGVKELALSTAVPVKSVLLAAHLRVMSLMSGQPDVLTCVVSNGRPESLDGERVLGLFLNSLPFRLNLQGGSWTDLIMHTFEAEQGMLPFRRYPMAELKKTHGTQPLSETLFYFTHYHIYQGLQKWNAELLDTIYHEESSFPLVANFRIDPFTSHLHLDLDYDQAQFYSDQIETLADYYLNTFAAMVHRPAERYDFDCLLSAGEERQLTAEWNATAKDYPLDSCIHNLFEEQVKRNPNAVALVYGGEEMTYEALNRRANQLAIHLQKLGVGPEAKVGICVERNVDMVAALFGILKAGGVYVPLDPAYPAERLALILEHLCPIALVTQERFARQVTFDNLQPAMICLDSDSEQIDRESEAFPPIEVRPDNLAYCIHTSGSTGVPKGVAIQHGSTVAMLHWARHAFSDAERVCVLAATSLSFDLSVFELFVPLSWGGTVVLVENALHLTTLPESHGITLINTVPSVMAELIKLDCLPESVRTVNLAGEILQPQLVDEIYRKNESIGQVFDLYGPSETTTYSTFAARHRDDPATIGRPIDNTQILLLDSSMQLVPIGVPGELYIGGAGLARGYLDAPDLTAERFVPNPFSNKPGARLYKTGDLARYRADGQLDYIGRIDHQVKIRGFRIELSEIEVTLLAHPTVEEAVVLGQEDAEGDKRLVAYIVPGLAAVESAKGNKQLGRVLRRYLEAKLPAFLIPQFFVVLDGLPRLSNGKVNRAALPEPERRRVETDHRPPQNDIERAIAQVWQEALHMDKVGTDTNFFDLGGHSLLMIQVQGKLRNLFERDVSIVDLFKYPTIHTLAKYIAEEKRDDSDFWTVHKRAEKQKEAIGHHAEIMKKAKGKDVPSN